MSPVFRHGRLRLYLLKLLDESPRHGYEVIRLLRDRFMGVYAPSPGTIYPRLARLEEDGLVTHDDADGRKVYRITEKGREELRRRSGDLSELEEEITASVRDIAREVTEDVRETVRNLRRELSFATRDMQQRGAAPRHHWPGPDTAGQDTADQHTPGQDAQAPGQDAPGQDAPEGERERLAAEWRRLDAEQQRLDAERERLAAERQRLAAGAAGPGAWGQATGESGDEATGERGDEATGERGDGTGDGTGHGTGHETGHGSGHETGDGTGHETGDGSGHGTGERSWEWGWGGGRAGREWGGRDLEQLARQFTAELRAAAAHAHEASEQAAGELRVILDEALDRIRSEVFRAGGGSGGGPGSPGRR